MTVLVHERVRDNLEKLRLQGMAQVLDSVAEEEYLDMPAARSKWATGLSAAMSGTGIEAAECRRRMARHLIREALLK